MIKLIKTVINDFTKLAYPERVGPIDVGYIPSNWNRQKDPHTGLYVYEDNRLNILQTNLVTMNQLLADLRVDAKLSLVEIKDNLQAATIKDPTVERVGWIMSKIVECVALAFPAGKPAAVVAGLICRMASGGIQFLTKDNSQNPDYQQAVNDLRNSVDQFFSDLEDMISSWIEDPQSYWVKAYVDPHNNYTRLCDLAEHDQTLPQKNASADYNHWFNELSTLVKKEMTKNLLPVHYRIGRLGLAIDEDSTEYSAYWFWNVAWYEVRNSNTWDAWRSSPNWPYIPDNLQGDITGPHEDIGNWEDIKGGHQYYQSINRDGKVVLNAALWDSGQYWWTRKSGSRWMYWGGRHCTMWDAKEQGSGCDSKVDSQNNIIQGTPFLDWIDDIIHNRGYDICSKHGDSVLVYYEVKDPHTGQILRNTRRADLMTSTDGCKDYFYQINWFKWNWCYTGIQVRFLYLHDDQGNRINDATARWLFKDDGHGNTINSKGIADRLDVYFNWGLSE